MKKFYEDIKIEILLISSADVVTLSDNQKDDTATDIFDPLG